MIKPNTGDTIVEVLIAMAIMGLVLTGAFVTVNRDSNTSVRARERSQALGITEMQLERLQSLAANKAKAIYTVSPGIFCLDSSLTRHDFTAVTTMPDLVTDNLDVSPPGNYPAGCVVDSSGSTYSSSSPSTPFSVFIERNATDHHVFNARVRWERAGGGRDEISITHRLYEWN